VGTATALLTPRTLAPSIHGIRRFHPTTRSSSRGTLLPLSSSRGGRGPPPHHDDSLRYYYIAIYKPYLMLCKLQSDQDRALRKHRPPRATLVDFPIVQQYLQEEEKEEASNLKTENVAETDTANPASNNRNSNPNQKNPHLHLVGRLDRDSEGLLLLTNDGQFTSQVLMSLDCHKTYWVLVQGQPNESALQQMRAGGLSIRGAMTRPPISVERLTNDMVMMDPSGVRSSDDSSLNDRPSISSTTTSLPEQFLPPPVPGLMGVGASSSGCCWLQIVLNEGRNRQIRRITQHAGHATIRLVRVGIGSFHLLQTQHAAALLGLTLSSDSNEEESPELSRPMSDAAETYRWKYIDRQEVLSPKKSS